MEAPDIAETSEIELQRFRLDEPFARHVIDHKMREVRLPGDGTKSCEFRCGETGDIVGVGVRMAHPLELGVVRGGGRAGSAAQLFNAPCAPHPEAPKDNWSR